MNCPHCHRPIPESALRCRHCRRALSTFDPPGQVWGQARFLFANFRPRFADEPTACWGLFEVSFFFAVLFASDWWLRHADFAFEWTEWLRRNFFIFTREPLLQLYTYVFVETFVLKLGLVLLILFYIGLRGRPVFVSLGLTHSAQNRSALFFKLFLLLCATIAWFEGLDPLSPDLPTPLFFPESATLGNSLALVSVICVAPVTEEIIFRGFMYPAFLHRFGQAAAILCTSVLFAAAHAPQLAGAYEHLGVIFLVGLLLSWRRAVTGSTLHVIGLHALYNVSLMAAGFLRFSLYGF